MNNVEKLGITVDQQEAEKFIESETVDYGGESHTLDALIQDITTAHRELDEYKTGSLAMSQNLAEAADAAEDELQKAILEDMADTAFLLYLRLQRGDKELIGERSGQYSGYLKE